MPSSTTTTPSHSHSAASPPPLRTNPLPRYLGEHDVAKRHMAEALNHDPDRASARAAFNLIKAIDQGVTRAARCGAGDCETVWGERGGHPAPLLPHASGTRVQGW